MFGRQVCAGRVAARGIECDWIDVRGIAQADGQLGQGPREPEIDGFEHAAGQSVIQLFPRVGAQREIDQAVALVDKLSQRGLTIVIVEHVMRAIMAVATHIVVLDHGQKIAEGGPKQITENPEVIRAYLGSGYVQAATGTSG